MRLRNIVYLIISLLLLTASTPGPDKQQVTKSQTFTIRKIKPVSAPIKIGGQFRSVDKTFKAGDEIEWTDNQREIRAVSYPSGKLYIFTKEAFKSKNAKTAYTYLHKKGSSRDSDTSFPELKKGVENKALFPEKRIALVIGNCNYYDLPFLNNPFNDAKQVSEKLLSLGFDVMTCYDCTHTDFNTAINTFFNKAKRYDVALFYYAGHGMQHDEINYLQPIDFDRDDDKETSLREMISVNRIAALASESDETTKLIFIDACRNDVNYPSWTRGDKGIATEKIPAPNKVCTMFSTATGKTADDGDADNSPFASVFLKEIDVADKPLEGVLASIRKNVVSTTRKIDPNKIQTPICLDNTYIDFYFKKGAQVIPTVATESSKPAAAPTIKSTTPSNTTIQEQPIPQQQSTALTSFISGLTGTHNGHEWVDLGLPSGTLWATCNLGASTPAQTGSFYAWGEVLPKEEYLWTNYKFCSSGDMFNNVTLSKYVSKQANNYANNTILLDSYDDAARVNWGGNWRMPTEAEIDELLKCCSWSWAIQLGQSGYKVTSTINGKSIFLPLAGSGKGRTGKFTDGYYWSSSPSKVDWAAYYLLFANPSILSEPTISQFERSMGFSIRPVISGYTGNKFSKKYSVEKESSGVVSTLSHKATSGTINGHEWVDLGLPSGIKWATCNVGANSPEEYGDVFAWGEIKPKSEYNWETYTFTIDIDDVGSGSRSITLSKYNTMENPGIVDNKQLLDMANDAAHTNWGGSWRIPTNAEFDELKINCTWTWTSQGGKNGYTVASKTNGNSIFLPAAGWRGGKDTVNNLEGRRGYYWSSSLDLSNPIYAMYCLLYDSGIYSKSSTARCFGLTVRPVTE